MRVLHSFHGTYDNDETYELPDARETAASGPAGDNGPAPASRRPADESQISEDVRTCQEHVAGCSVQGKSQSCGSPPCGLPLSLFFAPRRMTP